MNTFRALLAAVFNTPPDDVPPCVAQANSFREVVSLQALFVTLTVGLLAYVRSSPTFELRVDLLFAVLASLPMMGLYHIVASRAEIAEAKQRLLASGTMTAVVDGSEFLVMEG